MPEGGERLFNLYFRMVALRDQGDTGPRRLQPEQVVSWLGLHRERVSSEELAILDRMDQEYVLTWRRISNELRAEDEANRRKYQETAKHGRHL